MKKLMLSILTFIFALSLMAQDPEPSVRLQGDIETEIQKEIQQEISSDMDEVKMWMTLYSVAEKHFINIMDYPEELHNYMLIQTKIIEDYFKLVEEAEVLFYDKGDFQSKIKEAKNKMSYLRILKQIFDDYVTYKEVEKSRGRLELTIEAIKNDRAIPRMHISAYTVLRGEYPIKTSYRRTVGDSTFRKEFYEYRNGDVVVLFNGYINEIIVK